MKFETTIGAILSHNKNNEHFKLQEKLNPTDTVWFEGDAGYGEFYLLIKDENTKQIRCLSRRIGKKISHRFQECEIPLSAMHLLKENIDE